MIKLLRVDVSGRVPCPEVSNPTREKLDGLKTLGGVSLQGRFPALTLVLRDGPEAPPGLVDYFTVGLLKVVSTKLKGVFENIGAEFEYFPVTVCYGGKPTAEDFFVANPLERFAAVDLANSEIELDAEIGDALTVNKLFLDETRFKQVTLAVIAEINEIGVTQEVVAAVEAAGCIGCAFVEPSTVRY